MFWVPIGIASVRQFQLTPITCFNAKAMIFLFQKHGLIFFAFSILMIYYSIGTEKDVNGGNKIY